MAALDLRRLQAQLANHLDAPLYLLIGSEAFLLDEAIQAIKSKTLSTGATDFNFDSFYAPEADTSKVYDVIETLPMMCPKRLVIYKWVHLLKEKDWALLEPLFTNPVESSVVVLVAEKIDKRKKIFKKLLQAATVVDLQKPYDNQMPSWIEYIAHKSQLKINHDAVLLLSQLVGTNLNEIQNEILKLKQFKEGEAVTEEDVMQVVSRSRVDSVFEFTEALGQRDKVKALCCLANLLDHGQNEVGALALVNRHLKILNAVIEAKGQGLSQQKMSQKVGVPLFFMKQYLSQAHQWNPTKMSHAISALYTTDKALKSSPVSSHIWLENFVLSVCD